MNKKISDVDQLPLVMSATDLQLLGFSRSMVYQMLRRADFPAIVIGNRKFVQRERFFAWLEKQEAAS